jgi:hypothetical protein
MPSQLDHTVQVIHSVALHIAGLPVEEILLAGLAAATPMIALIGWEIRDRVKRLRRKLSGRPEPAADAVPDGVPDAASEVP